METSIAIEKFHQERKRLVPTILFKFCQNHCHLVPFWLCTLCSVSSTQLHSSTPHKLNTNCFKLHSVQLQCVIHTLVLKKAHKLLHGMYRSCRAQCAVAVFDPHKCTRVLQKAHKLVETECLILVVLCTVCTFSVSSHN